MIEKQLYRVREVAAILSCSERTVYRLIKDGFLASHKPHPGHKGTKVLAKSIREYVENYTLPEEFL